MPRNSKPPARKSAQDGLRATGVAQPGRRRVLIYLPGLAGMSLLPGLAGCGGSDDDPALPASAPEQPAGSPAPDPSVSAADVQLAVSFQDVSTAAPIDSRFAGLSYEKAKLTEPLYTPSNRALVQLFRLLGPDVLRIGANAVDRTSWNGEEEGLTPILPTHIDALAEFLDATQWQLIYGVNMARNTPENAAREAAYVASRIGPALLAWEIGNEPDLYRRHGYRPDDWAYDDYIEEWRAFRDAMSAAVPNVPFSGPATAYDVERFTLPFARDEGSRVPLLTHHYYRADRDDPDSDLELLLEPDPALQEELATLVAAAAENGMTRGVRIAEANSFYGGGLQNVSNAFGTALWTMDFLFNCAIAGATGVNMHSGGSGPGYTPISEREGVVIEARPTFYGMLMFTLAAQGMPMASVMEPDVPENVSAWGVRRDDGGFNAILINKEGDRSVEMNLTLDSSATTYDPMWLRGTSLSASAGQTLDGIVIDNQGNWVPPEDPPLTAVSGQLSVVLPPASAVLLRSLS